VRGQNRHRALQVRVSRHDDFAVAVGSFDKCSLHVEQQFVNPVDGRSRVEFQVGRDLIVATAAGVQLSSCIAESFCQPTLDVHVDVFERRLVLHLAAFDFAADVLQFGDNLVSFVVRN
jgi:hypothetical protein